MAETSGLNVPIGPRDHVRGSRAAPLVLVEYGDFECPHCGRAFGIVQQLEAAFGDALCFVFRHFPLTNVHPHAQRAAETAEWAAGHDRFWPVHDRLFRQQDRLDERSLLALARDLGLDPAGLQHAWDTHAHIARVKEDLLSGIRSGVSGTPGFFVGGRRHDGPWDLDDLTRALEASRGAG